MLANKPMHLKWLDDGPWTVAIGEFNGKEIVKIRSLSSFNRLKLKSFLNYHLRHRYKNLKEEEKARFCFSYVKNSEINLWQSPEAIQKGGYIAEVSKPVPRQKSPNKSEETLKPISSTKAETADEIKSEQPKVSGSKPKDRPKAKKAKGSQKANALKQVSLF